MDDLRDKRKHQDSDSGNVTINAELDVPEIANRKYKATGSWLYDGSFEDGDFSILPGEPVYQVIEDELEMTHARIKTLRVMSVLTGIFNEDTSEEEAIAKIRFIGFAGGQGATKKNPGLSVKIASKLTVINYSRQTIPAGSLVFWKLPNRGKRGGNQRKTRPLLELCQYNPKIHNLSEYNVCKVLTEPASKDGEDEPLFNGCKNFLKAEMTMTLIAMHWLAKVGFINIDLIAFKNDGDGSRARRENKNTYNKLSEDDREKIFQSVAINAGMEVNKKDSNGKYNLIPDPKIQGSTTTAPDKYLIQLIASENKSSLIFPFTECGRLRPGFQGEMLQHQKGMKSDLFAGITATNHYYTNRIIGKAMNVGGGGGGEFEINLGHYSLKPC